MSFCSSPDRKTIFLPASGFGALVGPSQVVWGPAYLATAALASDTASARAGATANIPASATAPVSKAKWQTSTFILLSSHFRVRASAPNRIRFLGCRSCAAIWTNDGDHVAE